MRERERGWGAERKRETDRQTEIGWFEEERGEERERQTETYLVRLHGKDWQPK